MSDQKEIPKSKKKSKVRLVPEILFPRSIRKGLVIRGDLKKYLSYASGEIVLVMIGILLALQVNKCVQNDKNAQAELKILRDLKAEFLTSYERIKDKQEQRIIAQDSFKIYLDLLSMGKADLEDYKRLHTPQMFSGMTNPPLGIINALISSNSLELIKNDSLKYLISDWKDQLNNLKENEQVLWKFVLDYKEFIDKYYLDDSIRWPGMNEEKRVDIFNDFSNQVVYQNKVITVESVLRIVISECEGTLEHLRNLISLIEEETGKNK